jgi:dTDP-glucose pyrophosphorylase
MPTATRKAVIMARGLGTRMRRADAGTTLAAPEATVADTGVKALMPIAPSGGRSRVFLDYVISGLADAGYDQVCLVVGPEHDALRERYTTRERPRRAAVSCAVQDEARGTADAVLAARTFAGDDLFLVINSDNYYPVDVLRALRLLGRPGLAGFDRHALGREGNIDRERIERFALLRVSDDGDLQQIVEKPGAAVLKEMGADVPVSMNAWVFGPRIFEACAAVRPSVRGELELTEAVQRAMAMGERFAVLRVSGPVLDLTSRADIADVARRLQDVTVDL